MLCRYSIIAFRMPATLYTLSTIAILLLCNTVLAQNNVLNGINTDVVFTKMEPMAINFTPPENIITTHANNSEKWIEEPTNPNNLYSTSSSKNHIAKANESIASFRLSFTSFLLDEAKYFLYKTKNINVLAEEKKATDYVTIYYKHKRKINVMALQHHAYNLQVNGYIQNNVRISGNNVGVVLHPSAKNLLQYNDALSMLAGKVHQQQYLPYFPSGKFVTEMKLERKNIDRLCHPSLSICMRNYFAQRHLILSNVPQKGYTLFDLCMGSDINILHQQIRASMFCSNIFGSAYFNHLAIKRSLGVYDDGRNTGVMLHVFLGR